jgi:creatinine amidohydrolase
LSNDFGPQGLIGDPTGATAERGKELFEAAVRAFGEALAEVRRFDFGRA